MDGEDSEEDEDDGPEDNEYYAGGEKSGVAVRGGKKTDHIENLFDSAREHGAVQGVSDARVLDVDHGLQERRRI